MKLTFQDPITPIMYGISALHDHILFFLAIILFLVLYILISTLQEFHYLYDESAMFSHDRFLSQVEMLCYTLKVRTMSGRQFKSYVLRDFLFEWAMFKNHTLIEIVWTVIPSFILLLIAVPSFALLFAIDELAVSKILVKVIGHQWYWSYEVTGIYAGSNTHGEALAERPFKIASFDSYMLSDSDLIKGDLRLLKTDNALILPKNTPVSVLITSEDVLHSWAIPSFGVKVDAVPGRLSQISLLFKNSGSFYGQCSELCGVNHGFMPIEVWVVDINTFARLEMFLFSSLRLNALNYHVLLL